MTRGNVYCSLAITLLVVFVFGVLRNYGPESIVRQFHFAAARNDRTIAKRICVPNQDAEFGDIYSGVQLLIQEKWSIALGRVDRSQPNRVVAQFNYYGYGALHTIFWVVERRNGNWRINPAASLSYAMGKQG